MTEASGWQSSKLPLWKQIRDFSLRGYRNSVSTTKPYSSTKILEIEILLQQGWFFTFPIDTWLAVNIYSVQQDLENTSFKKINFCLITCNTSVYARYSRYRYFFNKILEIHLHESYSNQFHSYEMHLIYMKCVQISQLHEMHYQDAFSWFITQILFL